MSLQVTNSLICATLLIVTVDFCLIPIGTASTSVAEEVAECQRILAQSGLVYKVCLFFLCKKIDSY